MSKKKGQADGEEKVKLESKFNPIVLRDCISNGMDAAEIMQRLDIKHKQTLKQYLMKLCTTDKVLYEIPSLYQRGASRPKANKKLELKISLKSMELDGVAVQEGDEFTVTIWEGKIILERHHSERLEA